MYAIRISRSRAPHFVHVSPMLELAISAPYATTNRAVLSRVDLSRVQTTQMAWLSPRSASPLGHLGRDQRVAACTVELRCGEWSALRSSPMLACWLAQSELPLERTTTAGRTRGTPRTTSLVREANKPRFYHIDVSTNWWHGFCNGRSSFDFSMRNEARTSPPWGVNQWTNTKTEILSRRKVARGRRTANRVSRRKVTVPACGSGSPTPPETSQVKQSAERRPPTALDRAPRQERPTPWMTPPTRSRAQGTKA